VFILFEEMKTIVGNWFELNEERLFTRIDYYPLLSETAFAIAADLPIRVDYIGGIEDREMMTRLKYFTDTAIRHAYRVVEYATSYF
jgi:hypothetical protein